MSRAERGRGEVRIIGGSLRRRRLRVPAVEGVRPSPDRVRETLFNWLGQDLEGWQVLDLFAGSGALGFEAASRGAARVVMVERHPLVLRTLRLNREQLGASAVEIVDADARRWAQSSSQRFDLVLADPPFADARPEELLDGLSTVVKPSGMVYLETPAAVVAPPAWQLSRAARAGSVHYQLLVPRQARAEDPAGGA